MKVHNTTTEKNTDIGDIKDYKRKEKLKKRVQFLIIVFSVVMGVILIYLNRDTVFEPLRGIFSKVTTTTDDEAGFPVNLPSSSDYHMNLLGNGFSLLTDTYLYTYSGDGVQNFALQHGYVNPACCTNSKRVLIYDKGGHSFALYNWSSEIYKQTVENEVIVSAYISQNEYTAIVTSGNQYSNVVYIYDGNGRWVYTHRYIEEKVMQAAFSPDERYLYLTLAKSEEGDIITEVVKYEIGKGEVWSIEIADSISFALISQPDSVTVITDEKISYIDAKTGALKSNYEYSGILGDYDIGTNNDVFLFQNNSEKTEMIVILDKKGTVVTSSLAENRVKDIKIDDQGVVALTGDGVTVYDSRLSKLATHEYEDEYVEFIKLHSNLLLMGVNYIDCKRI